MSLDSAGESESEYVQARQITAYGDLIIYVFGKEDLISSNLLESQTWESGQVHSILSLLKSDPEMGLIDIGCNIGTHTLPALLIGRRVVALDPNLKALRRLARSIRENRFQSSLVSLVFNGVSDRYEQMFLSDGANRANRGGARMQSREELFAEGGADGGGGRGRALDTEGGVQSVQSVLMDDLLDVTLFQRAVLKMDTEGSEPEALRFANRLFQAIEIRVVFFEWGAVALRTRREALRLRARAHSHSSTSLNNTEPTEPAEPSVSSAERVRTFFDSHCFAPFAFLEAQAPLAVAEQDSWPWDVVWKRRT